MEKDKENKPGIRAWLTPAEVADGLRITRRWVYQLIDDGRIPSIRIGKHIRVPLDWFANPGRPEYVELMNRPNSYRGYTRVVPREPKP